MPLTTRSPACVGPRVSSVWRPRVRRLSARCSAQRAGPGHAALVATARLPCCWAAPLGRRSLSAAMHEHPLIVLAAGEGDLATVRHLLAECVDVDSCGSWTETEDKGFYEKSWTWSSDTALCAAVRGGHTAVVAALLAAGANPSFEVCAAPRTLQQRARACAGSDCSCAGTRRCATVATCTRRRAVLLWLFRRNTRRAPSCCWAPPSRNSYARRRMRG